MDDVVMIGGEQMLEIALCIILFIIGILIGTYVGIVVAASVFRMGLRDSKVLEDIVCSRINSEKQRAAD